MSNEISIKTETQIIDEKLLSLDLNSLTLEELRSYFTLYPTMYKAQEKGWVAHHPYPMDIQRRDVEKKYGVEFGPSNEGRKLFEKSEYPKDDRCYRMTHFGHILDHYLMARDYGGDYVAVWDKMQRAALSKCTPIEQQALSSLYDWAKMNEQANAIVSEKMKDWWSSMTPEEYDAFCAKVKERNNTPEVREKNSKSVKNYYANLSEEERQKIRDIHAEAARKDDVRKKISEGCKKWHNNLSDEEKEKYRQLRKDCLNTEDAKANCSKGQKERFAEETEEEKEIRKQKHKEAFEKNKDHILGNFYEVINNRTKEDWMKIGAAVKKSHEREGWTEFFSQVQKACKNTPQAIENKKKKTRIYYEMKEKGAFSGTWNEFSSWYSKNKDKL